MASCLEDNPALERVRAGERALCCRSRLTRAATIFFWPYMMGESCSGVTWAAVEGSELPADGVSARAYSNEPTLWLRGVSEQTLDGLDEELMRRYAVRGTLLVHPEALILS